MRVHKFSPAIVLVTALTFLTLASPNAAGQTMVDIHPPGYVSSRAVDINRQGDIIINATDSSFRTRAFGRQYTGAMINLGTLGGTRTTATDINDLRHVVGYSTLANGQFRAFLYRNGRMISLGTLGGTSSVATAVNNRDEVVGSAEDASGQQHAFLWRNGQMIDLGRLDGSVAEARDINDSGWVVGLFEVEEAMQVFLYRDGRTEILGNLGGYVHQVFINNLGHVAGYADTPGEISIHAFLWRDGVMMDLGAFGGDNSRVRSINERGDIAGTAERDGPVGEEEFGFLYRNGQVNLVPTFGGRRSALNDVNDNGRVVGWAYTSAGAQHALVSRSGRFIDLGTLGGEHSEAVAINNNSVVVGGAETSAGDRHAFYVRF